MTNTAAPHGAQTPAPNHEMSPSLEKNTPGKKVHFASTVEIIDPTRYEDAFDRTSVPPQWSQPESLLRSDRRFYEDSPSLGAYRPPASRPCPRPRSPFIKAAGYALALMGVAVAACGFGLVPWGFVGAAIITTGFLMCLSAPSVIIHADSVKYFEKETFHHASFSDIEAARIRAALSHIPFDLRSQALSDARDVFLYDYPSPLALAYYFGTADAFGGVDAFVDGDVTKPRLWPEQSPTFWQAVNDGFDPFGVDGSEEALGFGLDEDADFQQLLAVCKKRPEVIDRKRPTAEQISAYLQTWEP